MTDHTDALQESEGDRGVLLLGPRSIERVAERDPFFARELQRNRGRFVQYMRSVPGFVKAVKDELKPGEYYRAIIPTDVQRGLRDNTLEFVNRKKSGLFTGMIREADGRKRFTNQVEWARHNPDPQALANLNAMSVQAGIAELTERLLDLDRKLERVLLGQHTDRVAEVKNGVDLYEQAFYCQDPAFQRAQLANAVQDLTKGRRKLMEHLAATLNLERNDPTLWQRFLKAVTFGWVDEPAFELVTSVRERYPEIKEDLRYINRATAYLFRAHTVVGEAESATRSVGQYEEFLELLDSRLPEVAGLLPYEAGAGTDLATLAAGFESARPSLRALTAPTDDLVVDVTYEEIHHDL